ncbi:MAG: ATP-dependent helicase HrpB [Sphingomonadaceae bacterium]
MQSSAPIEAAADLPVRAALPDLRHALDSHGAAVLVAPPGTGKTTLVAPALLDEPWLGGGRILLLLPRRLAARAAAERIAELLGERPGARVGYATRLEAKAGRRIECLTTGIFVNRLIADPGLEGVGCLLLDEVHERSLEADLALALALEARALRPELRLVAMSATIEGEAFARLLGDAPLVRAEGRQHPVTLAHIGRGSERIETAMAAAIRRALVEGEGDILAFLPGAAEIARTADALGERADLAIHQLHGAADPAAQRAALAPDPAGRRKIILATSIAETSLTIDGVRIVVDSGLARRPRFDRAAGLTRLATERVSQAAATQRAGRAGRQAPGLAIRLWDEAETRGLIPQDPPEILEADLAPLLLRLLAWGASPEALAWLDPPQAAALAAARDDLAMLGAIGPDGRLTPRGRAMAKLPVAPRTAALLLAGAERGQAGEAARIAVLLEERGLGGLASDLEARLARFAAKRGVRTEAARRLAQRWAEAAAGLQPPTGAPPLEPAALVATAWPERVARRRRAPGRAEPTVGWLMANGRGALLDAADPLARHEWLAIADAGGSGADARIRLAAGFSEAGLAAFLAGRTTRTEAVEPDPASGRLALVETERLGAIEIARRRRPAPPEAVVAAMMAEARDRGVAALPWPAGEQALRARIRFAAAQGLAGLPDVSDAGLADSLSLWLEPRLAGCAWLADVRLDGAIAALLDWPVARALDRFAPAHLETPAGSRTPIDYAAPGGPEAEVRVQALFGLGTHPMLAEGRVPLILVLTSPAGRPIARTADLPGFWSGGWRDVQRDMKGRYPKHPWPDDPASAAPTLRTRAAARRPD